VATDLKAETINIEQTYDITKVRRKNLNGVSVMCTTIDTYISLSATVNINPLSFRNVFIIVSQKVTPDITEVAATLAIDLTDKKKITLPIDEVGNITRDPGCFTCKSELVDVPGAASLVYCAKCQRHSLKRNNTQNISTTVVIRDGKYCKQKFGKKKIKKFFEL